MIFLDTNILLYSIGTRQEDAGKAEVAQHLLERRDAVLSVQVLQEFYVQATRASRPDPLPHEMATAFIHTWHRFRIIDNTLEMLDSALKLRMQLNYSLWDCLIIIAAQTAECSTLYTEDMSHGRRVGDLVLCNPFL